MSRNNLFHNALGYAYRLLGIRDRTETEIKRRLKSKGWGQDVTVRVLNYLKSKGLIDDVKFVKNWIRSRSVSNPKGPLAIKDELIKLGIDERLVNNIMSDSSFEYDEYKVAKALVDKKLPLLKGRDKNRQKRSIYTCLAQRGFSFDVINDIINNL